VDGIRNGCSIAWRGCVGPAIVRYIVLQQMRSLRESIGRSKSYWLGKIYKPGPNTLVDRDGEGAVGDNDGRKRSI
jgi:hypothetical protein